MESKGPRVFFVALMTPCRCRPRRRIKCPSSAMKSWGVSVIGFLLLMAEIRRSPVEVGS